MIKNIPEVKLGIVVGSVDYLPTDLAIMKRQELVKNFKEKYPDEDIYECPICVGDNEMNVKRALKDLEKAECNALCIFYADYGPEATGTLLAGDFDGPCMLCAAAEDDGNHMIAERKDSLSGIINACYALSIRNVKAYIPKNPMGDASQCADMIYSFLPIARTALALKQLKIIEFGPRPASYYAAYAPTHQLHDIGVEIEENSELELLDSFEKHAGDRRIDAMLEEMKEEMNLSETPAYLPKLAQFEVTLNDWIRNHKGNRKFITLTDTCWPAFPLKFGFVPCYVNSRFTGKGFPISCEVDVYGTLSEYIGQVISRDVVTLLNIHNTVPVDVYEKEIKDHTFNGRKYEYSDLFIGYHCGVTCSKKLKKSELKPHYVNNQLIGEEKSQGTIQGTIIPGEVTCFRIQGTLDGRFQAYVAEGQVLPVDINTYGGIGVFAIPEMERFIRNVIIENHYPNHVAVVFGHYGREIMNALKFIGIERIDYNHSQNVPYESENAFELNPEWN